MALAFKDEIHSLGLNRYAKHLDYQRIHAGILYFCF